MRIAVIGSRGINTGYGGIERMLDELCPRLCRLGYSIDVFCRPGAVKSVVPGLKTVIVPALAGKHSENITRSLLATIRAMGRYDLVHFHAMGPGILSLLTRAVGQPSVVTIHARDSQRDKWGRLARLSLEASERTLVQNASGITVVSEALRQYFRERHDLQTVHIPNGIPQMTRQAPGPMLSALGLAAGSYVLFASRLVPEKGAHDLIACFQRLKTGLKLVIAGAGDKQDYVDSLKAAADPARVVFVGHRSGTELAELFSNTRLFVLPSYIEGMSMALLEAVAYRLPILASDIAENRAILGDYGNLFPPRDRAALTAALEGLANAPDRVAAPEAAEYGLNLPNWDDVAIRYERFYTTVLQGRPRLAPAPIGATIGFQSV